ncbi:TPA: hypothetical protein M5Q67_006140 [Pseudomonas aeruginosa]|nr:hypothetical protein [Pseudomonas aeruginosa]
MPAGLTVFNDNWTFQINEDYSNVQLKSKGTFTVSSPTAKYTYSYKGVLFVEGDNPEVYVTGTGSAYIGVGLKERVNNGWNFTIYSSTKVTFTYYVFDTNLPPAGTFGLQVFKENGSLVYDSSWRVLRIIDVFTLGYPSSQKTYTSGRVYAARLSYSRQNLVQGPIVDPRMDSWTAIAIDTFRISSNTVYTDTGRVFIGVFPQEWYLTTPWAWGAAPRVVVADVTGY